MRITRRRGRNVPAEPGGAEGPAALRDVAADSRFGASDDELKQAALADPKVQPFLSGKQVVKVIVVPDKLVNIVVR